MFYAAKSYLFYFGHYHFWVEMLIYALFVDKSIQLHNSQSAFFDFCVGNRHQLVVGARVKAMKVASVA